MASQPLSPRSRRVVIVGGGFTGACVAVQLMRKARRRLEVTLVDPAAEPGAGLAYRTADPDHRLNAPSFGHSLLPDDPWHFSRWVVAEGLRESDPASLQPDGTVYVRRGDFGRYLRRTLEAHRDAPDTGSTLAHVRDRATTLNARDGGWRVGLASGAACDADLVVVATGNPPLRLPGPIDPALAAHPAVHADAIDGLRVEAIAADASVLLLGSGLTALDVLSTLIRRGHRGPLTVLSRQGLRPRPNASPAGPMAAVRRLEDLDAAPPAAFLARFDGPPAGWIEGRPPTVRAWMHALRQRVREVERDGGRWQQAFDELRDGVWQLWPRLPAPEQRRFLSRLRPWYDVHRFRSPPPNEALVRSAVSGGQVRFVAGRVLALRDEGGSLSLRWRPRGSAAEVGQKVDALVNCTGLDAAAVVSSNPFLAAGCAAGWLQRDELGWGLAVDGRCRAVGADGRARDTLRVLGPPSAGRFGDPLGAVFIGAQVQRVLPDLLQGLDRP